MPTTEELFKEMESEMGEYVVQDDRITLTSDTSRTMNIPTKYRVIGVESDERTERLLFRFPKIVGDNIDLSSFGIRVNYENANGEKSYYTVDDVEISGEDILFSWLLERNVTKYKGTIKFIVCAIKTDGRDITNEWNTTLASSEVLEGLEPKFKLPDEDVTEAELLIAQCSQKLTEMSVAKQDAEQATSKAIKATQDAVNATQDARDAIDQITKDSYLHTTLQSFVNKETVNPTSYGNVIVKELQGYAKQQKTNGYQLFDASKIQSKTQGGATVTNNGDGSFTISGSGNLSNAFATYATMPISIRQGNITLKQGETTYPNSYINLLNESGGIVLQASGNATIEISKEDAELIKQLRFGISGALYGNIVPGTIKPMLYQNGDGTWEPFTGGKPAPSPDYPQFIHGLGDMGYFDGEFVQGNLNSEGSTDSALNGVTFANKIPCNPNDNIIVKCEKQFAYIFIAFYDSSGKYISRVQSDNNVYEYNVNAIENAEFFTVNLRVENEGKVSSLTAGHIVVTINNNYAVIFSTENESESQSSRTYIPISAPLYSGDKIYQKDMQCRVYRQWGVAVFDGSEDEAWGYSMAGNVPFTYITPNPATVESLGQGYCNILNVEQISVANASEMCVTIGINIYVANPGVSNVNEWKTWLQSNPITVVYQLATPTDEPLSDAGVIAMYSLMACDELTNVSIAGVPDDAEVSNQLYFPRNVDGAWNTTAYALARKNEVRIADIFAKINNDAEVMT